MKKLIYTISAVVIGTGLLADVINFTAGEGYSAGELSDNSKWDGHSGLIVDPVAGSVSYTNTGFQKVVYQDKLDAGNDGYAVGIVFSFDQGAIPSGNNAIITAEFSTVNTATGEIGRASCRERV